MATGGERAPLCPPSLWFWRTGGGGRGFEARGSPVRVSVPYGPPTRSVTPPQKPGPAFPALPTAGRDAPRGRGEQEGPGTHRQSSLWKTQRVYSFTTHKNTQVPPGAVTQRQTRTHQHPADPCRLHEPRQRQQRAWTLEAQRAPLRGPAQLPRPLGSVPRGEELQRGKLERRRQPRK